MFFNYSAGFTPSTTLSSTTHALLITCYSTSVPNYYCPLSSWPSVAPASLPMPFAHFTNLVLPISRVWPSLLRLCSSLESSHIFLYWFILHSGSFSISPSSFCLDASRGSGLQFQESCCFQPGVCYCRHRDAPHHQQRWKSINTQRCDTLQ